jgi:hypothetical protein
MSDETNPLLNTPLASEPPSSAPLITPIHIPTPEPKIISQIIPPKDVIAPEAPPPAEPPPVKNDTLPQKASEPEEETVAFTADATQQRNGLPLAILEGEDLVELGNIITRHEGEIGASAFAEAAKIPESYEDIISSSYIGSSVEATRANDSIAAVADKTLLSDKLVDAAGNTILTSRSLKKPTSANGAEVAGNAALFEFARRRGTRPIRSIPLYNSGFHINIMAPNLAHLHKFYSDASENTGEYGRRFGIYFYLYGDLNLKRSVVNELFIPLICGSNLSNWNRSNVLMENISIHDYKVILWYLACMMYPEGFDKFTHVCRSEKCNHVTIDKIDLNKFVIHNYSLLPEYCIKQMADSTVEITTDKLKKYKEELKFNKTLKLKHYGLNVHIPSIYNHIVYGNQYNGELTELISTNNNARLQDQIGYEYYRSFTPWVDELIAYNEDGTVDIKTSDSAVISRELAYIQAEDTDYVIKAQIENFINDTEITHIGYPVFKCPACNHTPVIQSGFFTVDPLSTFFTLAVHRLSQR